MSIIAMVTAYVCSHARVHGSSGCHFARRALSSRSGMVSRMASPKRVAILKMANRAVANELVDDGDDDDEFFGHVEEIKESLGMQLPQMTAQELDYFNTAPDEESRLARLKEIAVKRHQAMVNQKVAKARASGKRMATNTADDYMENLARASSQAQTQRLESMGLTPPPSKSDAEAEHLPDGDVLENSRPMKQREPLEVDMSDQVSQYESPPAPASRAPQAPRDSPAAPIEDILAQENTVEGMSSAIEELERQLADTVSTSNKPSNVNASNVSPSTVDKQIDYLQQHLEKLQAEAMGNPDPEEVKAAVKSIEERVGTGIAKSHISTPSPSDGMGEMTRDETMAAFDMIREQQAEARAEPPLDPLAVPLPSKAEVDLMAPGASGPSDDVGAADENLRIALISLRMEHSRYIDEQKESLERHEANIEKIFTKYAPELE